MSIPEMKVVISSNVEKIGYDAEKSELYVQYKGENKYIYQGVFPEEYAHIEESESKGKAIQYVIGPRNAPRKTFTKQTEEKEKILVLVTACEGMHINDTYHEWPVAIFDDPKKAEDFADAEMEKVKETDNLHDEWVAHMIAFKKTYEVKGGMIYIGDGISTSGVKWEPFRQDMNEWNRNNPEPKVSQIERFRLDRMPLNKPSMTEWRREI